MSVEKILYESLRIRRIEEAIANEYSRLECRQPVHLDIGAEWSSVVVCHQLQSHDKVFGGHRSHSQYLSCGNSAKDLIAGLMGKNDLSSMHLHSDGIFAASGSIVGGMIPVATGAAFAKKLKKEAGIVVCFLGDGATEQGVFGESLSFSKLHGLSILFIVQNNKLAVTTPVELRHTYNITDIAKAYGLEVYSFEEPALYLNCINDSVEEIIKDVRLGKPTLIEFFVERKMVHCGVEKERELLADYLEGYVTDESEIHKEIEEAFALARKLPIPTAIRGVYAD